MNRLQAELQRLYLPRDAEPQGGLVAPDGRVRAMALGLAAPASSPAPWELLAKVWQGVQADLQLPAPAIAVNGSDGYRLWFSLAEPVAAAQASAFLAALQRRYLADVAPERIALLPADASASGGARPDAALPPAQAAPGHWSAFVAPDLAALFADEPWLDLPAGEDAQADLLSRLQSMKPAEFQRALAHLGSSAAPGASATVSPAPRAELVTTPAAPLSSHQDPRRFLLDVMNDPAVDLHLRIEAAKALLPYLGR